MTVIHDSTVYSVLIVGCGNIGGRFDMAKPCDMPSLTHAGAFTRHPGFRLVACVEPNNDRRHEFANYWKVGRNESSITCLNAEPMSFDVIAICSPTVCHKEHLEAAINLRPRLIFCEKPLTDSFSESSRQVRSCLENNVSLAVNYSRRWDILLDRLDRELQSGRWGSIRSVVGYYNKGIKHNGGHMFDLLLRLVGPMKLVSSSIARYDFWADDPSLAVLLRAKNDDVPVFLSPADARDYAFFELELICEKGVIRMESGGQSWRFRTATESNQFNSYKTLENGYQIDGSYLEVMDRAIADIYLHLSEGRALKCTGQDTLNIQKLCEQALAMSKSKI